jgi:hypothetical protein
MSAAIGGILFSQPNQTLSGFIQSLVASTNKFLKPNPPIRFVAMIDPQDPNYTPPITNVPSSAEGNLTVRKNPNKVKQGLTDVQQAIIQGLDKILAPIKQAGVISMREGEANYAAQWAAYAKAQASQPGLGVPVEAP